MTTIASERQYDVITFGDLSVDLIVTGDDVVPQFGQVEKLVGDYAVEMGGSCSIFACQAARLGLRVGILGRVGDDGTPPSGERRIDDRDDQFFYLAGDREPTRRLARDVGDL